MHDCFTIELMGECLKCLFRLTGGVPVVVVQSEALWARIPEIQVRIPSRAMGTFFPHTVSFIKGSAEALPILCVSDFCEREREREGERERERERERETPVTSFDITLKSRVIMHMITSTARRPNVSTRSEPVECSCIRQGAWCLSARAAGNGRVFCE